jgi:hypothetical protein
VAAHLNGSAGLHDYFFKGLGVHQEWIHVASMWPDSVEKLFNPESGKKNRKKGGKRGREGKEKGREKRRKKGERDSKRHLL